MFTHPFELEDDYSVELPTISNLEQHLMAIYWCKKQLDEFLPSISTYATPKEISAIALSQASLMEKHLVEVFRLVAQQDAQRRSGMDAPKSI